MNNDDMSDEEFDAFLRGEDDLSRRLQGLPQPSSSAQLDAAILGQVQAALAQEARPAAANDAAIGKASPRLARGTAARWRIPAGIAASVLAGVLGHQVFQASGEAELGDSARLEAPAAPPVALAQAPADAEGAATRAAAPAPAAEAEAEAAPVAAPTVAAAAAPVVESKPGPAAPAPEAKAPHAPRVQEMPPEMPKEIARARYADASVQKPAIQNYKEAPAAADLPVPAPAPAPAPARVAAAPPVMAAPPATVEPPVQDARDLAPEPPVIALSEPPVAAAATGRIAARAPLSERLVIAGSSIKRADTGIEAKRLDTSAEAKRADIGTDAKRARDWLSVIDAMLKANLRRDALAEWTKFRAAYPDYPVPAELRARIEAVKP